MQKIKFNLIFATMMILVCGSITVFAQQPSPTEKQDLVMKFRKLTGADHVNLGINVSFEDIKSDLIGTVDNDKELTGAQKLEFRKSAIDGYNRLDKQLKDFLNDQPKITPISEAALFQVYDQAFTVSELKDSIAFYSTPTGQKALQFLPTLSGQVQKSFQSMLLPKVQEFITPKIKEEGELLKQTIQQVKPKSLNFTSKRDFYDLTAIG